jgi:Ser/Thr protein kinase RdoA (MazF antagonist)
MTISAVVDGGQTLAPDHRLPERDLLLDPMAMESRIGRIVGFPEHVVIERCALRRVKYRLGESLRVMYEVDVNGCRHVLTARAFPNHEVLDLSKFLGDGEAVHTCLCGTTLSSVSVDPTTNSVWWAFPADRRLKDLDDIAAPSPDWPQWPAAANLGWVRSELVEYRPEHCVTVRCTNASNQTIGFAKSFASGSARKLFARYNTVSSALAQVSGQVTGQVNGQVIGQVNHELSNEVRVPRALLWSERYQTLLLEPLPGLPWDQGGVTTLPATLGKLGRAIASIHQLTPVDLPRFDRLDTNRVLHCTELIAIARPDVGGLCSELQQLIGNGPPSVSPSVFLHGDVHPKNALCTPGQISLLDFDQASEGPAAADVASLLAVLHHGAIVNPSGPFAEAGLLGDCFAQGYASVRALPDADELRWFVAAALVAERAMRAVNRVNRSSLEHLETILAAALKTLRSTTIQRTTLQETTR